MFTLLDAARLIVATLLGAVVIALPGVALARGFRLARRDFLVVGLAVLPLADGLLARVLGLDAALAGTLALAVCGAVPMIGAARTSGRASVSWQTIALCLIWLTVVVFESVDLDVAGRLFQPITVIDTVKHAATTQAIVDTGAPPHDPFFLRPQRVSYYYLFYMLPALVERLGLGFVDARAAVGGCVVWVGFGLYALARMALERAGFAQTAGRRVLLIALLATGGLDIIGVLRLGLLQNTWLADPLFWNEQLAGWFESVLWVPHHVVGLIAAMLGLMTLAGHMGTGAARTDRSLVLASLCFAATLGLSVWVALVLAATAALWALILFTERRWSAVGTLALAGILASALAAPQLVDLIAGREGGASAAVAFTIRAFSPIDGIFPPGLPRMAARVLALPLNYFAGFGVLASGAILYWRMRDRAAPKPEFASVLVLAAVTGLTLGAFVKSTLFNNDLGWRVMLFPLLAALVWTIAALERLPPGPLLRRVSPLLLILFGLGWATTAYAFVGLRAFPWLATDPETAFVAADPATERALRVAYNWVDANLPAAAVLQHNPMRPRAFAFALYGRHRVSVADRFGSLYGADPRQVEARIAALAPIFADGLTPSQVRDRALANGVDQLVVTAADPAWRIRETFVWRAAPVYAGERVRIIPVAALAAVPDDTPAPQKSASVTASGDGR